MRENPWEWEEDDLQQIVHQKMTESLNVDFKSCAAIDISTPDAREKTKFDLSKDVSAFANSDGGSLVYGIVESKTHTAKKLDRGYDPAEVNHEWIGQVINSSIHQRIPDVRINTVQLSNTRPGRVAYVVFVPKGSTAHQASDWRYYKRFNFESVPMADHEIRDVMNRATSPKLSVELHFDGDQEGSFTPRAVGPGRWSPQIEVILCNDPAAGPAQYAQTHLFLPSHFGVPVTNAPIAPGRTRLMTGDGHLDYQYGEWQMTDAPIFPGQRRTLGKLHFDSQGMHPPYERRTPYLLWRVRALQAPDRVGAVVFERFDADLWYFQPATMEEVAEMGFSVRWDD